MKTYTKNAKVIFKLELNSYTDSVEFFVNDLFAEHKDAYNEEAVLEAIEHKKIEAVTSLLDTGISSEVALNRVTFFVSLKQFMVESNISESFHIDGFIDMDEYSSYADLLKALTIETDEYLLEWVFKMVNVSTEIVDSI